MRRAVISCGVSARPSGGALRGLMDCRRRGLHNEQKVTTRFGAPKVTAVWHGLNMLHLFEDPIHVQDTLLVCAGTQRVDEAPSEGRVVPRHAIADVLLPTGCEIFARAVAKLAADIFNRGGFLVLVFTSGFTRNEWIERTSEAGIDHHQDVITWNPVDYSTEEFAGDAELPVLIMH
jgi:hypothetical protein